MSMRRFHLIAACLFSGATSAAAQVSYISDERYSFYNQTLSGVTQTNTEAFFQIGATSGGTITAASVTPPGKAAITIDVTPPTYAQKTLFYASESAMAAALPDGTYSFLVGTPSGNVQYNLAFANALAPDVIPRILNFAELSTFNPTNSFTIHTNLFPDEGYTRGGYFSIFANGSGEVFSASLAELLAGNIVIPANTLISGKSYGFQLAWGNYQSVTATTPYLFNIYRRDTSGSFVIASSAVPDTATWTSFVLGVAIAGIALRLRRKSPVAEQAA